MAARTDDGGLAGSVAPRAGYKHDASYTYGEVYEYTYTYDDLAIKTG
jgi:hypothetical protein